MQIKGLSMNMFSCFTSISFVASILEYLLDIISIDYTLTHLQYKQQREGASTFLKVNVNIVIVNLKSSVNGSINRHEYNIDIDDSKSRHSNTYILYQLQVVQYIFRHCIALVIFHVDLLSIAVTVFILRERTHYERSPILNRCLLFFL